MLISVSRNRSFLQTLALCQLLDSQTPPINSRSSASRTFQNHGELAEDFQSCFATIHGSEEYFEVGLSLQNMGSF